MLRQLLSTSSLLVATLAASSSIDNEPVPVSSSAPNDYISNPITPLGSNSTVVTTDITVTDYTTYCPESTTVTITKCDDTCHETEITVTEATTLTVTGECIVPTTSPAAESSVAAESTTAAVSSFEGGANKVAVGAFAGVAAAAVALI